MRPLGDANGRKRKDTLAPGGRRCTLPPGCGTGRRSTLPPGGTGSRSLLSVAARMPSRGAQGTHLQHILHTRGALQRRVRPTALKHISVPVQEFQHRWRQWCWGCHGRGCRRLTHAEAHHEAFGAAVHRHPQLRVVLLLAVVRQAPERLQVLEIVAVGPRLRLVALAFVLEVRAYATATMTKANITNVLS